MKILAIKDIEDCFDGSFIKEVLFDEEITEEFVYYLGKNGNLDYFPSFAKPFFRLESFQDYTIKGVVSNKTARLTLLKDKIEESLINFKQQIDHYKQ